MFLALRGVLLLSVCSAAASDFLQESRRSGSRVFLKRSAAAADPDPALEPVRRSRSVSEWKPPRGLHLRDRRSLKESGSLSELVHPPMGVHLTGGRRGRSAESVSEWGRPGGGAGLHLRDRRSLKESGSVAELVHPPHGLLARDWRRGGRSTRSVSELGGQAWGRGGLHLRDRRSTDESGSMAELVHPPHGLLQRGRRSTDESGSMAELAPPRGLLQRGGGRGGFVSEWKPPAGYRKRVRRSAGPVSEWGRPAGGAGLHLRDRRSTHRSGFVSEWGRPAGGAGLHLRDRRSTHRSGFVSEWKPSSGLQLRQLKSVDQNSCGALVATESKLVDNTHSCTFNDLSGSVSLAWVGDGTGVILALTTFQVPFFMIRFGQSKLYRSEDYGKSFKDVTTLLNSTFIRSEFGIAIGPENSGKVILTAEVSRSLGSRIFVSRDFGQNFTSCDLPFSPLTQISYNPENSSVLAVISSGNELWVSQNFAQTWNLTHKNVCSLKWGRRNALFFTTSHNASCGERGTLELQRTLNYGKFTKAVARDVYSFGLGGRFLFASIMTGTDTMRKIQVSVDQGETWNLAQLPAVGHEQFYSILAANDEMVFMHVDEPGDTSFGTVYVSDDRGTVYSKSLERHLYTATGGDTDFTNVTSLRGVFITSVLAKDDSVQSVVSFDQGGEWLPLRKPADSECDATSKDPSECSLHIHAAYSIAMRLNVPMPPLTEPNGVGLIIAHGSVGDAISVTTPDVYVSDDGGYSWIKALAGPHHYAILDSGGILVAVEHSHQTVDTLKFSTDEGQCWHNYTFTKEPIYFTGLASEPGARSMNVSIWGYKGSTLSQSWVSITIDFRQLLNRDCGDGDYVQWLAHSDDISDPTDGCILGYKEKFLRLRKDSVCYNGRDYEITTQPTPCLCTLDDFLCDFGYYRQENSSECVEQPDLKGQVLEYCLHGKEEQLKTTGYRKIPGDKCEGGKTPQREELDLSKTCVSDLLGQDQTEDGSSSRTVLVVITVIAVMLLSVAAGVLFVKKYVCGGRFLVHRYSVLQQHVEDNAADVVDDPLETDHAHNGKIEFHDDSDEDLLE